MPSPITTIHLSFGLVTVPVEVYSATDSAASVSFVRIHTRDVGRLRNQPVCSREGTAVPPHEVGRGYRTSRGIVPLSDQDLEALPLPTLRTFAIRAFVDRADVDPLSVGHGYYLVPDGTVAAKPFRLLRDAMEKRQLVGLGKVALYGRETLAMIRPFGERGMALHELRWPHQIRPMAGVLPRRQPTVDGDELAAAEELMDSYRPLPDDLRDPLREQLDELAAAKLAVREPHFPHGTEAPATGPVVDLMAALHDSVLRARQARGEAPQDEHPAPPAKKPRG
ncbi:non-homologous end joining protein Ku [Streptomyces lydicus]|uniref:non-homologous end joining protein Ku n=1 Tax=Streptomyces lydicus TaxID=47763 RepID=UPI0036E11BD9